MTARHRKVLPLLAVFWLTPATFACAQANLPYEVATVKVNHSASGGMSFRLSPDGFTLINMPLKLLIANAYDIKLDLISGVPADGTHYDIQAKMDGPTAAALEKLPQKERNIQRQLMFQMLLADRFHLKAHRETKELPVYNLVIAKGGFKLKEADAAKPSGLKDRNGNAFSPGVMIMYPGELTAASMSLSNLASNLAGQVHRTVIDKTGLTGKYNVTLQWASEEHLAAPGNDPSSGPPPDAGPSIFTALQEQLGLRLESANGPVETLVVDHAEAPTEN